MELTITVPDFILSLNFWFYFYFSMIFIILAIFGTIFNFKNCCNWHREDQVIGSSMLLAGSLFWPIALPMFYYKIIQRH